MKNYRNPALKGEIKCRDCDHSTSPYAPRGGRTRIRCMLTGTWRTYAVAATGTCDEAAVAKATGGRAGGGE